MKNSAILIDTNILINFITDRDDPYKHECNKLMELCAEGLFQGYIAFHSLSTIWYVIRRQKNENEARFWLEKICDILTIASAPQNQIQEAVRNRSFRDFEDCLQDECAVHVNAQYIVTCNTKDFQSAKSHAITPDSCIKMLTDTD